MDAFFVAIEATPIAEALRHARWGYAVVNAAHILGFCLLVGAIIPLNLRLLGVWRDISRRSLIRVLAPVAAAGLALAVAAGLLLFSVRAREYAGTEIFQAKLLFVMAGTAAALAMHCVHGFLLDWASDSRLRRHALLSVTCWIGALICGRLVAFSGS